MPRRPQRFRVALLQVGCGHCAAFGMTCSAEALTALLALAALLCLYFAADPVKDPIDARLRQPEFSRHSAQESSRGAPDEAFGRSAVVLVREFVQSRYKDYSKGKVRRESFLFIRLVIGDPTSSEEPHRGQEQPGSHVRGL